MAIRKREHKDGFRYMLDYYDQTGNRRRETLPAGTTQKAAKDMLRKYEAQIGKGIYISESENRFLSKWRMTGCNIKGQMSVNLPGV